jgi:hypothetical protein
MTPPSTLRAHYGRIQRHDDRPVMTGWPLVPGLMRPVPVVMPGVGPRDRPQLARAVDQHPAGAPGPYCPYPASGITVRPGRHWRALHDSHAPAGQDVIERDGELGVPVTDKEAEGADPAGQAHDQGAGLLGRPCAVRVPGLPRG